MYIQTLLCMPGKMGNCRSFFEWKSTMSSVGWSHKHGRSTTSGGLSSLPWLSVLCSIIYKDLCIASINYINKPLLLCKHSTSTAWLGFWLVGCDDIIIKEVHCHVLIVGNRFVYSLFLFFVIFKIQNSIYIKISKALSPSVGQYLCYTKINYFIGEQTTGHSKDKGI